LSAESVGRPDHRKGCLGIDPDLAAANQVCQGDGAADKCSRIQSIGVKINHRRFTAEISTAVMNCRPEGNFIAIFRGGRRESDIA